MVKCFDDSKSEQGIRRLAATFKPCRRTRQVLLLKFLCQNQLRSQKLKPLSSFVRGELATGGLACISIVIPTLAGAEENAGRA
jgi:hypothetical protein